MTYLIFKTPTSVWCDRAEKLLQSKAVEYVRCDITDPEYAESREWLLARGHRTVPQVYLVVDDRITEYIGGYDKLVEHFKKITH